MVKLLTVIFKDVEQLSDISLKTVPDAKDTMVLLVEGATVVLKISELEEAIAEIKRF